MEWLVSLTELFAKFITWIISKEKVKETIYQLIDYFPLVCIERGNYVIVDYCETVFHPRMVSEMMCFDKPEEPDADSAARSFLEERIMKG